jgi:hypothetical protein
MEINLTFAEHRVIAKFAEDKRVSRVAAVQLMLDTSTLFNETLTRLRAEKDGSFEADFNDREDDMKQKREKIN